ncbi:MAG TPA: alpha/beta hydrolase [Devosiaceae bacterium]|nr:alpha/beta hydrolase [Devosiaceae bacterium]
MLRNVLTDDGISIAYGDFGPRHGQPVVLCHGLCASGRQFESDAAYFSGLGYRVLVPDLRGHGRSGAPADHDPEAFTIPRLARDMVAVLDHAEVETVDWVGNSLGGIVALGMVEGEAARFRSLATFGTSYRLTLPPFVPKIFPLIYRLFGRGIVSGVTAQVTTDSICGRALVAEMLKAFDPHAGQAVAQNVRRYDLIDSALHYEGPILMIRGGRDRAVNAALGRTLKAMEGRDNFKRVDLKAAAHCANLDAPEEVRQTLVEFWRTAA